MCLHHTLPTCNVRSLPHRLQVAAKTTIVARGGKYMFPVSHAAHACTPGCCRQTGRKSVPSCTNSGRRAPCASRPCGYVQRTPLLS